MNSNATRSKSKRAAANAGTGPAEAIDRIRREVREVSQRRSDELRAGPSAQGPRLSDALAEWLLGPYVRVMQHAEAESGGEIPCEMLRQMANGVAMLRKGDQRARQLELWRERIEIEWAKTTEGKEKGAGRWETGSWGDRGRPLTVL